MTTGCIPAHALYFSSYEFTKAKLSTPVVNPNTGASHLHLGTIGASVAGAVSTFFHDLVMTPMDTIKQRMQLGNHEILLKDIITMYNTLMTSNKVSDKTRCKVYIKMTMISGLLIKSATLINSKYETKIKAMMIYS